MNNTEILNEITYNDGFFPREALESAIANKDAITQELLKILEYAIENSKELEQDHAYMGHIYAMYLLAQFREKRAYPLIIQFFSMPGEISLDLTGDVATETLCQILASVCNGDISLIASLIENKEVNEYVRAAAVSSLICLVAADNKLADKVIDYIKSLFNGGLEREYSFVWDCLIYYSSFIATKDLFTEIQKAVDEELLDNNFVGIDRIEELLDENPVEKLERLKRDNRFMLIDDTIGEIEGWACFDYDEEEEDDGTTYLPPAPLSSPAKTVKIGRNAPCPCRSGKKYKKCCLHK